DHQYVVAGPTDPQLSLVVYAVATDDHPGTGANAQAVIQPDLVCRDGPVAAVAAVHGPGLGAVGVLLDHETADGDAARFTPERGRGHARLNEAPRGVDSEVD